MSANRRRRRRRMRGIVRTQGAGVTKQPIQKKAAGISKIRLERQDYVDFHDGQGRALPHKPQRSALWATHDVDMHPTVHGKRNATRRVTASWGCHFLRMREWARGSFIRGKGLHRRELNWLYALYVQGRCVGYTDDAQYGLGWSRAANEAHDLGAELRPTR